MTHAAMRILASAVLLGCLGAPPARAADHAAQLSLVTPIQIFPDSDTITGVRLNLLYGRNVGMTGLDLGLFNHTTTGDTRGLQFGLVGIAEQNFLGWQDNLINYTGGDFTGLQVGAFNYAADMQGLQLGLVNYAGTIKGLQIGLVNIIREGGFLPVCIIVNGSF